MHKITRYCAIFIIALFLGCCLPQLSEAAPAGKSGKKSAQVLKTSKKSGKSYTKKTSARYSRRAETRKSVRRARMDAAYAQNAHHENFAPAATPILLVKPTQGEFSSGYGYRRLGRSARMHKGVDFSAPRGTPVVAAADGVVSEVGRSGAYGRIVEIEHGSGVCTRYAHLDAINVQPGERVRAGKMVGTVGRSGRTTGANLHFEVLVDNRHINPMHAAAWTWVAGNEKRSGSRRPY